WAWHPNTHFTYLKISKRKPAVGLFHTVEMLYPKERMRRRRQRGIIVRQLPVPIERLQRPAMLGAGRTAIAQHEDQVGERCRIGKDVIMARENRRRFYLAFDKLQVRQLGEHLLGLRAEVAQAERAQAAPAGEQKVGELNC